MTQQIANLENELGIKLFNRNKRSLTLTENGKIFYKNARNILAQVDKSISLVKNMNDGYDSLLRIGFHGEVVKTDLINILEKFKNFILRLKFTFIRCHKKI